MIEKAKLEEEERIKKNSAWKAKKKELRKRKKSKSKISRKSSSLINLLEDDEPTENGVVVKHFQKDYHRSDYRSLPHLEEMRQYLEEVRLEPHRIIADFSFQSFKKSPEKLEDLMKIGSGLARQTQIRHLSIDLSYCILTAVLLERFLKKCFAQSSISSLHTLELILYSIYDVDQGDFDSSMDVLHQGLTKLTNLETLIIDLGRVSVSVEAILKVVSVLTQLRNLKKVMIGHSYFQSGPQRRSIIQKKQETCTV